MNLNKLMGGKRRVQDYWKPTQITQRQVMQWFDYVIDAGNMTGYSSCRYNYTAGVYGWNADIIRIAGGDIVVVAGYRPFGNIKAPSNLVREYEDKADKVGYDSDALDKLIEEFAYKVLEANGIDIEMDKKEAVVMMNGTEEVDYDGDNSYKRLKSIVSNSFRKKRGVDNVWTDKYGNTYTIELKDSRRIKDSEDGIKYQVEVFLNYSDLGREYIKSSDEHWSNNYSTSFVCDTYEEAKQKGFKTAQKYFINAETDSYMHDYKNVPFYKDAEVWIGAFDSYKYSDLNEQLEVENPDSFEEGLEYDSYIIQTDGIIYKNGELYREGDFKY